MEELQITRKDELAILNMYRALTPEQRRLALQKAQEEAERTWEQPSADEDDYTMDESGFFERL